MVHIFAASAPVGTRRRRILRFPSVKHNNHDEIVRRVFFSLHKHPTTRATRTFFSLLTDAANHSDASITRKMEIGKNVKPRERASGRRRGCRQAKCACAMCPTPPRVGRCRDSHARETSGHPRLPKLYRTNSGEEHRPADGGTRPTHPRSCLCVSHARTSRRPR